MESPNPSYVFITKDSDPNTENEVVLTSLKKFSKYGVVIEAYNRMGRGPQSQEMEAFTKEDSK